MSALCGGGPMVERHRSTLGARWCFTCRVRHEFWLITKVTEGPSWYGPVPVVEGTGPRCRDLFPGCVREWDL